MMRETYLGPGTSVHTIIPDCPFELDKLEELVGPVLVRVRDLCALLKCPEICTPVLVAAT